MNWIEKATEENIEWINDPEWALLKESWGDGPWQTEPDFELFEYRDHKCMVRRGSFGALNGYVEVKPDHAFYKQDYDDIDVDVHMGITYAGNILDCLDIFFIGFDCAHCYDYAPVLAVTHKNICIPNSRECSLPMHKEENYKTIDFVIAECKSVVDQLIDGKTQEKE